MARLRLLTPAERRTCQRRRSWYLVKVTDLAGARVEEVTNLWDLSERGVAFYTNTQWPRGALIALQVNLPVRAIPASARVVRIARVAAQGRYRIGAEFTDIATQDRALLRRIVGPPHDHEAKRPAREDEIAERDDI